MSYSRKINYTLLPNDSFKIMANCSGCGAKAIFQNTNCFRVNANGNKIDVWLIYQCSKCKHTKNLTVHERCKPESIERRVYEGYQSNSGDLSLQFGTDTHFFSVNKAEIDWSSVTYRLEPLMETVISDCSLEESTRILDEKSTDERVEIQSRMADAIEALAFKTGDLIRITNRHALKIRTDKIVSEILGCSRSVAKKLEKSGAIIVTENKKEHQIVINIQGDLKSV